MIVLEFTKESRYHQILEELVKLFSEERRRFEEDRKSTINLYAYYNTKTDNIVYTTRQEAQRDRNLIMAII